MDPRFRLSVYAATGCWSPKPSSRAPMVSSYVAFWGFRRGYRKPSLAGQQADSWRRVPTYSVLSRPRTCDGTQSRTTTHQILASTLPASVPVLPPTPCTTRALTYFRCFGLASCGFYIAVELTLEVLLGLRTEGCRRCCL